MRLKIYRFYSIAKTLIETENHNTLIKIHL
jgi:hypothetical protein